MRKWLLVVASLRDKAPTAAELQAAFAPSPKPQENSASQDVLGADGASTAPAKGQPVSQDEDVSKSKERVATKEMLDARQLAAERVIVLNRGAAIAMVGPSFTERSRLLIEGQFDSGEQSALETSLASTRDGTSEQSSSAPNSRQTKKQPTSTKTRPL